MRETAREKETGFFKVQQSEEKKNSIQKAGDKYGNTS